MNILSVIKERKVSSLLEIKSETIKPVTEKQIDGQIKTTDNLQIEFCAAGKRMVGNVIGYLHYYDESGNNVGHDFDLTNEKFKPGELGYLSFILEPPDNLSYAVIEIDAEELTNRVEFYVYIAGMVLLGLNYSTVKYAFTPLLSFGVVIAYLILLRVIGHYVATKFPK